MIDLNKDNTKNMWKAVKEIIRGEPMRPEEVGDVDFEILGNWKSAI